MNMPVYCQELSARFATASASYQSDLGLLLSAQSRLWTDQTNVSNLNSQLSSLQSQLSGLQGQESSLELQIESLQSSISQDQSDLADLQEEIQYLESYLLENPDDQNNYYLEAELAGYQSQYSQEQSNLYELQNQLWYLQSEQSSLDGQIMGLQFSIWTTQSQLSSAQAQQFADQYEVTQLQEAVSQDSENLNSIAAELWIVCDVSEPGVSTLGLEVTATNTQTVTVPLKPATNTQTVTAPPNPATSAPSVTESVTVERSRFPHLPLRPRPFKQLWVDPLVSAHLSAVQEDRMRQVPHRLGRLIVELQKMEASIRNEQSMISGLLKQETELRARLDPLENLEFPELPKRPKRIKAIRHTKERSRDEIIANLSALKARTTVLARLGKQLNEAGQKSRTVTRQLALHRQFAASLDRVKREHEGRSDQLRILKQARLDLYVEARYLREAGLALAAD